MKNDIETLSGNRRRNQSVHYTQVRINLYTLVNTVLLYNLYFKESESLIVEFVNV